MSDTTNALFNALGAYDSDGEGSDTSKRSSSPSEVMSIELPSQRTEGDGVPIDNKGGTEDTVAETMSDEEPGCHMRAESYEVEYASVDGDKLAAYVETKHNLDALLGCDTVPDFEPAQDETKCSEELQAKFQQWYQLKEQGANFNEALMRNKTFRNPNIYRWLVDHLQLEEAGTNLQSDGRFDPARLRNDFSAKGLADEQERRAREYAARKAAETSAAKAAGTTRNIQFQSAGFEKIEPQVSSNRQSSSSTRAHPDSGRSFEEAVQRAKLIAQHLARPKKQ